MRNGGTPLLVATFANQPACVRLLLAAGADATRVFNGKDALTWARDSDFAECASLLEEAHEAGEVAGGGHGSRRERRMYADQALEREAAGEAGAAGEAMAEGQKAGGGSLVLSLGNHAPSPRRDLKSPSLELKATTSSHVGSCRSPGLPLRASPKPADATSALASIFTSPPASPKPRGGACPFRCPPDFPCSSLQAVLALDSPSKVSGDDAQPGDEGRVKAQPADAAADVTVITAATEADAVAAGKLNAAEARAEPARKGSLLEQASSLTSASPPPPLALVLSSSARTSYPRRVSCSLCWCEVDPTSRRAPTRIQHRSRRSPPSP